MIKLHHIAVVITASTLSFQAHAGEPIIKLKTAPHFMNSDAYGKVLVGQNDLALYTFKKDAKLGSYPPKCTNKPDDMPLGSCLKRWPAATISTRHFYKLLQANPKAPYGAVYNPDIHKLQLTYEGLPLYYWFKDNAKKGNNFTGLGIKQAWGLKSQDKDIGFDGTVTDK